MDYIYNLLGYSKNPNQCATKIQSVFKGHLYRKKINSVRVIQKYYKKYNLLRLAQVYKEISSDTIKINSTKIEYCKNIENDGYGYDCYNENDEKLEDIYRIKKRQLLKLNRKIFLVKHELDLLEENPLDNSSKILSF